MPRHLIGGLLWGLFALLAAAIAYVTLDACELGVRPLFGLRYCEDRTATDLLAAEKARDAELRTRLHRAELRLAQLPRCLPPQPEPDRQKADTGPDTEPPIQEELKVPSKLADLEGCWQSERGDLPLVSDDAEQRPMGNVRKCYCFRKNGRGDVNFLWTDGVTCRGRIKGEVAGGTLKIHQPEFSCGTIKGLPRGFVRAEVACSGDESGSASCDTQTYGNIEVFTENEKYHRVSNEHCGWKG